MSPNQSDSLRGNIPVGIDPDFLILESNCTVILYEGEIFIKTKNGKSIRGIGSAYWSCSPTPSIQFTIKTEDIHPFEFLSGSYHVVLCNLGVETDGFSIHQSSDDSSVIIKGVVQSELAKRIKGIKRIKFHMINSSKYIGRAILRENKICAGRLELQEPLWRITIDQAMPEDAFLGNHNLFQITHVGIIEKSNGEEFILSDADSVLDKIGLFFSFVEGRYCAPIFIVGECDEGAESAFNYRAVSVSPSRSRSNFYGPNLTGKFLEEIWSGFHLIQNLFGDLLVVLISYLSTANAQADQSQRMIFSATILEMLFWRIINREDALQNADNLPLSDKIRLLLMFFGLPREIPKAFTKLKSMAENQQKKWIDGPQAIAEIRNSFTHAKIMKNTLGYDPLAVHQAAELALWYAESTLLKFIGMSESDNHRIEINSHLGEL